MLATLSSPAGITFTDMVLSGKHVCGLDTVNDIYCAGYNDGGQLGDGSNTNKDASSGFVKVVTSDKFKYISAKSFSGNGTQQMCCNNR